MQPESFPTQEISEPIVAPSHQCMQMLYREPELKTPHMIIRGSSGWSEMNRMEWKQFNQMDAIFGSGSVASARVVGSLQMMNWFVSHQPKLCSQLPFRDLFADEGKVNFWHVGNMSWTKLALLLKTLFKNLVFLFVKFVAFTANCNKGFIV